MEMLQRNDFITPTFNGDLRMDKPPLHYYFMISAYKLFGINAFSARLFSALFGLATTLLLYFFGSKLYNKNVGFYTALIFISSLHIIFQFHWSVPDPYLICFLTLAFGSLACFYTFHQKKWIYLFYVAVGLGCLTKGPVAIALPAFSAFVYIIASGNFNIYVIKQHKILTGILIVLLIAAPWYILVHLATDGAWTKGFFLDHNIGRFSSEMEGHGAPFIVMFLFAYTGVLPFSVFLFHAIKLAWRRKRTENGLFFLLISALCIITFFSVSRTKLPGYIAPSLPLLAFIVGRYLAYLQKLNYIPKRLKLSAIITLIIATIIPPAVYFALHVEPLFKDLAYLGWPFIIMPIGAFMGFRFLSKMKWNQAYLAYALSFILAITYLYIFAMPRIDRKTPTYKTKDILNASTDVVAYKRYNPAFNFELKHDIPVLETPEALEHHISKHPESTIITTRKFYRKLAGDTTKYDVLFMGKDLFESPHTIIMKQKE